MASVRSQTFVARCFPTAGLGGKGFPPIHGTVLAIANHDGPRFTDNVRRYIRKANLGAGAPWRPRRAQH